MTAAAATPRARSMRISIRRLRMRCVIEPPVAVIGALPIYRTRRVFNAAQTTTRVVVLLHWRHESLRPERRSPRHVARAAREAAATAFAEPVAGAYTGGEPQPRRTNERPGPHQAGQREAGRHGRRRRSGGQRGAGPAGGAPRAR